jgi:ABC-type branched-subunit amino acid transport system substrate-binding protein
MSDFVMRRSSIAIGTALTLFFGCTLLVNQEAAQCRGDSDCVRFLGTTCVQGGCVPRDAGFDAHVPLLTTCTSTQECETQNRYSICRSNKCESLLSQDCGRVIGAYTSDDVLLLGAILPIFGPHKSSGLPLSRSLTLALGDFEAGIPYGPTGVKRPVAVVLCNESEDAGRAALHLTRDVKVPAIIGPAFSAAALSVARDVTVDAGVLIVSPRAAVDFPFDTRGLVWRTAPRDAFEAQALARLVERLEARLKGDAGPATISVAVLHKADVAGTSLERKVVSALRFNGLPAAENGVHFRDIDYGNPDDPASGNPGAKIGQAVTALLTPPDRPDVIIVIGDTEAASSVVGAIEGNLPVGYLPFYLLSSGVLVTELLDTVGASKSDVQSRILVTAPGAGPSSKVLHQLLVRYQAAFPEVTDREALGTAQTFDAAYLLAYALAAVRNNDIVGRDVSDGLIKIFGGASPRPVPVEPDAIDPAFAVIRGAGTIDLDGTSGPLDFDTTRGITPSDVQVWCIVRAGNAPSFATSGLSYSAATGDLVGALTCL